MTLISSSFCGRMKRPERAEVEHYLCRLASPQAAPCHHPDPLPGQGGHSNVGTSLGCSGTFQDSPGSAAAEGTGWQPCAGYVRNGWRAAPGGWDKGLRSLGNQIVLLLIVDSKIVDRELVDTHIGFDTRKMMNFQRIQFSWEEGLECSLSPVLCGSYQCLNGNKIRHLMWLQPGPQALLLVLVPVWGLVHGSDGTDGLPSLLQRHVSLPNPSPMRR